MKIVVATHNKGKLKEFNELLKGFEIVSICEFSNIEPEENGKTFEENALIKARDAFVRSGLPSIADDSGLCVDALNGAPGIYSARFAETQEKCNEKLLGVMQGLPDEQRTAKFVCCIAYVDDKTEMTVRGECTGKILHALDGNGGFGYDPLFFSDELGKSFGSATDEEKNATSHRAKALALFKTAFNNLK